MNVVVRAQQVGSMMARANITDSERKLSFALVRIACLEDFIEHRTAVSYISQVSACDVGGDSFRIIVLDDLSRGDAALMSCNCMRV